MSKVITDDQLDGMIKSAVASMGALPPDEKFSLLVNALRELRDYRKTTASAVPDGWKLVPIEPTREMREAFHTAHDEGESGDFRVYSPDHEWQAMLAAAPEVE